jgi:hypothetical protein
LSKPAHKGRLWSYACRVWPYKSSYQARRRDTLPAARIAVPHAAEHGHPQEVSRALARSLVNQEFHMSSIRTFATLSSVVLITTFAMAADPASTQSSTANADEHAKHHPAVAASAPTPAGAPTQDRMKAMREMRDKMMNAKTPEERQVLMADHMKAMQDGMQMMKGMGGMDTKGMPADMAQRQRVMEGRMDMMQMMMDMMMQRMPASVAPAAK